MKTYARAPSFLEVERMYKQYGELLANVLYGAFNLDTQPRQHMVKVAAVPGPVPAEDEAARPRRHRRSACAMKLPPVAERLTKNRFLLDEEQCHIEVDQEIARATGAGQALVACCPAHV